MTLLALALGCVDRGETTRDPDAPPFLLGVNLPWLNYGQDFSATAWGDATLSSHPDDVLARLLDLSDHGVESVRWWLFADGRGSPGFDADGAPIALTAGEALDTNFTLMLDLAEQADLTVIPVLLDFGWCAAPEVVDGVTLGGHADVLADTTKRSTLVNDVIGPLAAAAADHPALEAWDLFNEPEWAFDGELNGLGDHCSVEDVQAYVSEANAAIASVDAHPTTVGSASYAWMLHYWADADPGLLQLHAYWEDVATLDAALDKPVLLGEFSTAEGELVTTLDAAWNGGFAGAFPWSAYAEDDASDLDLDAYAAWAKDR